MNSSFNFYMATLMKYFEIYRYPFQNLNMFQIILIVSFWKFQLCTFQLKFSEWGQNNGDNINDVTSII